MNPYAVLALVLILAAIYVAGALLAARLLGEKGRPEPRKHQAIECSSVPIGDARIPFKVGYYLIALVFMVFEVEALFFFPAVMVLSEPGQGIGIVFVEVCAFVAVLLLGLVFAWRKRVLEWQ